MPQNQPGPPASAPFLLEVTEISRMKYHEDGQGVREAGVKLQGSERALSSGKEVKATRAKEKGQEGDTRDTVLTIVTPNLESQLYPFR